MSKKKPEKRKDNKNSLVSSRGKNPRMSTDIPSSAPAPLSDYRRFLNDFVVNKSPANFTQEDVDRWPESPLTPQGKIINEIAKKFNNNNKLGIQAVNKSIDRDSAAAYWGREASLDLPTKGHPDPRTIGHELVHANDHQIDQLNPLVWKNLQHLYNDLDRNSDNFDQSITNIQAKIDPSRNFSRAYRNDFKIPKVVKEINYWRDTQDQQPFVPLKMTKKSDNWSSIFHEMEPVLRDVDPATQILNRPFYLGGPSEFPAFMSERLTDRWYPNVQKGKIQALSKPEARFVHSTLGDMGRAYPTPEYPIMNHHVGERSRSLERAYPGLNSQPVSSSSQSPSSTPSSGTSAPSSSSLSSTSYPSDSTSLLSELISPPSERADGGRVTGSKRKKYGLSHYLDKLVKNT